MELKSKKCSFIICLHSLPKAMAFVERERHSMIMCNAFDIYFLFSLFLIKGFGVWDLGLAKFGNRMTR